MDHCGPTSQCLTYLLVSFSVRYFNVSQMLGYEHEASYVYMFTNKFECNRIGFVKILSTFVQSDNIS